MSTIYSKDLREESTITVEDDALEARKRRAVPTTGALSHELLLLYFAPTFSRRKSLNSFPAAWRGLYLKYPQEVLHSLEKRGFLEPAPALTCLEGASLPELQAARGVKQQFLKIIQNHINMIILYKIRTI